MTNRIKGLDGIRTIAVTLVVLTHNFYHKLHLLAGGAGVKLFFVLSGFLIISILHSRRLAIETSVARKKTEIVRFYANRFYRIWPIYFVTLAFAALTVGVRRDDPLDVVALVANILFVGNLLVAHVWFDFGQVGVFWSLAVEEQFYLWAGLALIFSPSRYHRSICAVAFVIAIVAGGQTFAVLGDTPQALISVDTGSLTNFGLIALGGLAALTMRDFTLPGFVAPLALAGYLIASVSGFEASFKGALFFVPYLLIPVVLVGIAQHQKSILVRVLELPPVRYIGRISYGIYLFHGFIGFYLLPFPTIFDNHATWRSIAVTLAAVALAALSWHFFEKPILDYRDRKRARADALDPPAAKAEAETR